MNQRIKEFIDKANGYWEHGDFNMPKTVCFSEHDIELFAELIVKECADFARQHNLEKADRSHMIHKAIKQHFAVEEQEKVAPKPKCSVCGTTENVRYMGDYQPYLCDSCIPF